MTKTIFCPLFFLFMTANAVAQIAQDLPTPPPELETIGNGGRFPYINASSVLLADGTREVTLHTSSFFCTNGMFDSVYVTDPNIPDIVKPHPQLANPEFSKQLVWLNYTGVPSDLVGCVGKYVTRSKQGQRFTGTIGYVYNMHSNFADYFQLDISRRYYTATELEL
jgi:hypothetical protein